VDGVIVFLGHIRRQTLGDADDRRIPLRQRPTLWGLRGREDFNAETRSLGQWRRPLVEHDHAVPDFARTGWLRADRQATEDFQRACASGTEERPAMRRLCL